jgi:hypothetical protein
MTQSSKLILKHNEKFAIRILKLVFFNETSFKNTIKSLLMIFLNRNSIKVKKQVFLVKGQNSTLSLIQFN